MVQYFIGRNFMVLVIGILEVQSNQVHNSQPKVEARVKDLWDGYGTFSYK